MKALKEISKADINLLIKTGVIKNTKRGFVSLIKKDPNGFPAHIGFYKTVNGRHRYIEDYYADYANKARNQISKNSKPPRR